MKKIAFVLLIGVIMTSVAAYLGRPDPDENPVLATDSDTVSVLDFSTLNSVEDLPAGWTHHKFWTKSPMELSLVSHAGKRALRCETNAAASIFGRSAHIALAEFPVLKWDWFVEVPIRSDLDESLEEGDDHPARLFIRMLDQDGGKHALEVIWSNQKYTPGDYKYIGDFPHYVANGLEQNIGRWHHQEIDLLQIYQSTFARQDNPTVTSIAIFCDSDNTGTRSVAYFTDVSLNTE